MAKSKPKKTPVLKLENIKKSYASPAGKLKILQGINLTLHGAETLAIVGESGAGKSTLLHVAGLLDAPDSGTITLMGQKIKRWSDSALAAHRRNNMGFVYQQHYLMRDFTALENVMMPLLVAGRSHRKAQAIAADMLTKVGLGKRLTHRPAALSGGEQQRVAIARALVNKPKILLADEPTGNLDPNTASEVITLLQKLVEENDLSLLLVTHSHALAKQCDSAFIMDKGKLEAWQG